MNIDRRTLAAPGAVLLALASLAAAGCGGPADRGLAKYPVRGSVRVNGEPAPGLIVTLHNRDANAPGNAARPVGVVDESGRFELSTDGDRDGAVAGDYAATFFWPSDNTPAAFDRLGGRFTDLARSRFPAKVEAAETSLPPFELAAEVKGPKPGPAGIRPPARDF